MNVRFWGTRGSLPASVTARQIREKVSRAIRASRSWDLANDGWIETFIDRELPFAVRGGYGGNTACVEIGGGEGFVLCDAGTGIREGKKIVYSTDMEHGAEQGEEDYPFIDLFRDADLLIFDAQYPLADAIGAKETWGHSSNLLGVELAVRAGVKRLCLFHSEPTSGDEALDRFLADTREYLKIHDPSSPLRIDLAYDGLEIAL